MQLNNTKDNHFVPQFYLKSFLDKEANLHLFDKKNKKVHKTKNLKSVAFRTNLYTVSNKISDKDINWFCKMVKINAESYMSSTFLTTLVHFLNDEMANLFSVKCNDKKITKWLNDEIKSLINHEGASRNQELLFCLYEDDFMPIYRNILENETLSLDTRNEEGVSVYLAIKIISFIYSKMSKKISNAISKKMEDDSTGFSDDIAKNIRLKHKPNNLYDLWHYIITQYFRTERIMFVHGFSLEDKDAIKKMEESSGANINNVMFLLVHYQLIELLNNLMNENYKIILVKNETDIPFLTSDCPATNPFADIVKDRALLPDEFEIYFPLSPNLAILCAKNCLNQNFDKSKSELVIDLKEDVDYWNRLIVNSANRFIYTNSDEAVKRYCSFY